MMEVNSTKITTSSGEIAFIPSGLTIIYNQKKIITAGQHAEGLIF
jgi:hypothetical protein